MFRRPRRILAALVAAAAAACAVAVTAAGTLPGRLTDQEFWALVGRLSEPGGSFRSENLLSNELRLQYVIPELTRSVPRGRAYIGVGPEQNFTYMAAVQPSIAFIVDIRRGNLQLQLMYKALFELSADRVEFVSRLFSRRMPAGLDASASAMQIFDAADLAEPDGALYERNVKAIRALLSEKHGFALSADDAAGIEHVYHFFYQFGPAINYASSDGDPPGSGNYRPSYAELMTATDSTGHSRSFLASEEAFAFVKALETKNLVVPVVGDFAGPRALRAVGAYLKAQAAVVSAFYVSNVEQYLRAERNWNSFCGNAARLPVDDDSVFIRAGRGGRFARGGTALTHELSPMTVELDGCDRRP